jgi:glycosyltransferase involved in cell wall biosynthesis
MGGFDITRLLKVNGIPGDRVIFPDTVRLRYGFTDEEMAALYEGMDFLLAPSYGEGFQVPLIEAMAMGTRVIASQWTAPQDLVSSTSYLVIGQLFWDERQGAYYQIPNISSIVDAMNLAVNAPKGRDQTSIEWASQFDTEKVWMEKWLPYFRQHLSK